MWEVLTLGQQPYPARTNIEVLQYVRSGGRLERPPQCPNDMYVAKYWGPFQKPLWALKSKSS